MDDATVEFARRGDRAAREQLLRSLQDPWYRLCLSLLRDPDAARDATQETAVRVLRTLDQFRGGSTVTTWSIGIAINVCREMRRRGRRDDRRWRMEDAKETRADVEAQQGEERDALRQALAELPERQREAVVLRFFEELSVEDAARAMGCAEGTVKATVHQAVRALKEKLKQLA